jgi:hypothetical protein
LAISQEFHIAERWGFRMYSTELLMVFLATTAIFEFFPGPGILFAAARAMADLVAHSLQDRPGLRPHREGQEHLPRPFVQLRSPVQFCTKYRQNPSFADLILCFRSGKLPANTSRMHAYRCKRSSLILTIGRLAKLIEP